MSDFILEYDILESIAKYSNSLGKSSENYGEQLESKIINAIENVTGPSSGYLTSASDSVRDKINALKLKSEAFYRFAEQILNLLEVAEQIDQEVADAIAAGREYFLDHHESLRIDDWKEKLLGLYVDIKNSIPLLGAIADILDGLDTIFESLKDSIKHWYECEGGKYIFDVIQSVLEVGTAVGFLALAVLSLSLPGAVVFAACGIIAAAIGIVNSVANVVTSFQAAGAAIDGNPAWAMIYGKRDRLSDVLRQTNYGNGVLNDLSNLGAGAIDITETVCAIVGFAEAGVGIARLFKGDAFKLLRNKGALNLSDLKSGVKNGILDLKSSIKQSYRDLKDGIKGLDKVEDVTNGSGNINGVLETPKVDINVSGTDWYEYFRKTYGKENVCWENANPSEIAKAWQGNYPYVGVDDYVNITLKDGDIIWMGEPYPTGYSTTTEAIDGFGNNAQKIFDGLQVKPYYEKGMGYAEYRGQLTPYRVSGNINVAEGIAKNNPQFGTGGMLQRFDPNFDYNVANGTLTRLDNMSKQLDNTRISLESYYKMMNSIN